MARENHVAALLQNGSLLVAGGHPGNLAATSSAEVFNPYGGTWTLVGNMSTPRRSFGACTLFSGKVLVAGGNASLGDVATAELYDPTTGAWTLTGSLANAREDFSTTCLADGRVLVAGGSGPNGILNSAEVYNPATGTWSSAGTMPTPVHTHGAVQLGDGRVLIAGGNTAFGPTNGVAIWNPVTNSWTGAAGMFTPRAWHAVSLLNDGRVLAAGGLINLALTATNSAEIYNPSTGLWSFAAGMHVARYSGAFATLAAGPTVISGVNGGPRLTSSETYDSVHNTWSLSSSAAGAVNQTATVLPTGELLLVGGDSGTTATTNVQLFGSCSNAAAQDGTACVSGNPCTQSDTCLSGVCLPGGDAPTCEPPAWSSAGVAYKVNDVVQFQDLVYQNMQFHLSNGNLQPGKVGIWKFIFEKFKISVYPAWFPGGAVYLIGDKVSYNGSNYVAINLHVSTATLTPATAISLWNPLTAGQQGFNGRTCLGPTQAEPIDHCYQGLGCDWATDICGACGGDGQPCCDGPKTPFGGVCVIDPVTHGCPVCTTGACNATSHLCGSCGQTAGGTCCPPDASDVFATCRGPGLTCNWTNLDKSQGTCGTCGGLNQPACTTGTCESGLVQGPE
ncbi:MAG: kelch repeat-containing protein, partial [Polyangiaceae bacterium]